MAGALERFAEKGSGFRYGSTARTSLASGSVAAREAELRKRSGTDANANGAAKGNEIVAARDPKSERARDEFRAAALAAGPEAGRLEALRARKERVLGDLDRVFDFLVKRPPAVTIFGSARLGAGTQYYAAADKVGYRFGLLGIPLRTGGGPNIMTAGPEGYVRGRTERAQLGAKAPAAPAVISGFSPEADPNDFRTQALNILLPFEQKLSPAIEVSTERPGEGEKKSGPISEFLFRKLGLYENGRGLVVLPGGFGTLDELFEVWALKIQGALGNRIELLGSEFWKPITDAIQNARSGGQLLVSPEERAAVRLGDDEGAAVDRIAKSPARGFGQDPAGLRASLRKDVVAVYENLARLPAAFTVVGGKRLAANDPAFAAIEKTLSGLAEQRASFRASSGGTLTEAARRATVAKGGPAVQLFASADAQVANAPGLELVQRVSNFIVRKESQSRSIRGLLAGPPDIETLAIVFNVIDDIQNKKAPKVPVVLMGKAAWQPIVDALRQVMLRKETAVISPGDIDLFLVTDDPAEALRTLNGEAGPQPLPAPSAAAVRPRSPRAEPESRVNRLFRQRPILPRVARPFDPKSVQHLDGVALAEAIRKYAAGHVQFSYDAARYLLFTAIHNEDGAVRDAYTGAVVRAQGIPAHDEMSVEHLRPLSEGVRSSPAEKDLHQLLPVDTEANSRRGSLPFGVVRDVEWQKNGFKIGWDANHTIVAEPPDNMKGDVARALFYVSVAYDLPIPAAEEAVLRRWNREDPVDAAERRRNAAVAQYQVTENPFVTAPELANRIRDF